MAIVKDLAGLELPGRGPGGQDGTLKIPYRINAPAVRDLSGRLKVSQHQNIYEADFEYGTQPLRWESFTAGSGAISHQPGVGGVRMRVSTASGDITMRQTRPYHRYQPGKTMGMATAVNFGTAQTNQRQRAGFLDDGNGVFFEQADPTTTNPSGMFVVYRTDTNGMPTDTRISYEQWSDPDGVKSSINWNLIQMIYIEYAWYGAGALRWGVIIDGTPYILHQFAAGNNINTNQQVPWARTGNLPIRYEQRNIGTVAAQNDMYHWGVSVLVDGLIDDQRGFTYSYGMALGTPRRTVPLATTRYPVMSVRSRVMGTIEYTQASAAVSAGTTTSITVVGTPWTVNQWVGRYVYFPGTGSSGTGEMGRITANTSNTLTFVNNVTGGVLGTAPIAAASYQIGMINRGQLLPLTLVVSSDAIAQVELIMSTSTTPIALTGASFVAASTLGSSNSFAERDVSATAMTTVGEVIMAFTAPVGGSGLLQLDLSKAFALYNTIRGNACDILTVAVTTSAAAANVGVNIVCQEAMS
jgi:hypothetical protein